MEKETLTYYQKNRDECLRKQKIYNEFHKEEIKKKSILYKMSYYHNHKEACLKRQKKYNDGHKEKIKIYFKKYYELNKDKIKERRLKKYKNKKKYYLKKKIINNTPKTKAVKKNNKNVFNDVTVEPELVMNFSL